MAITTAAILPFLAMLPEYPSSPSLIRNTSPGTASLASMAPNFPSRTAAAIDHVGDGLREKAQELLQLVDFFLYQLVAAALLSHCFASLDARPFGDVASVA